ncbi:MAG: S9 family peptidase, partial [Phocaeicola sp.]
MRRTILVATLLLLNLPFVTAQTPKSMTIEDLATWQRISEQRISDDGKWVACKMEPWEGDATLLLYNAQGKETMQFPTAKEFLFSASSSHLIINQVTGKQAIDSLKLAKIPKDNLPMDRVILYSVAGKQELLDSIKSYKLSPTSDWLAYQQGRSDSSLHVRSLDGATSYTFKNVMSYQFAQEGAYLYFLSAGENKEENSRLFTLQLDESAPRLIKEGKGAFKQITFHPEGKQLAFLYSEEQKEMDKQATLWLSTNQSEAKEVVVANHPSLPAEWVISPHGALKFSKEGTRLFFGTAPKPFEK